MIEEAMFAKCYQNLELRMKARAETDGDTFLPNPTPSGPVDYALVCMEPSLGRWAATPEAAHERIAAVVRNFIYSLDDFIVHYCASMIERRPISDRYDVARRPERSIADGL